MNAADASAILWPVVALAGLTMVVMLVIAYRRFKAGFAGRVRGSDFKYGESANVPGDVSLPNRNYMNLLESPVLFYVACLAFYVTGKVDAHAVALAWVYVALRFAHSAIHITYNKIRHRLVLFALSYVALVAIWLHFALSLASHRP